MTPLERPAEFAGKATVTDEEARVYEKKDHKDDAPDSDAPAAEVALDKAQKAVGALASDFWEDAAELARVGGVKRTSLIVDPPDGKIPPRTPDGEKRYLAFWDSFNNYAGVKERPLSERCLPDSEVPIVPVGLNDNYQIVQTPDAVMILAEIIHDARIVRINGAHLRPNVRQWLGDSIGHWEGDTLVVDTTNFTDQIHFHGSDSNLHVIERFTLTGPDTLRYRFTIDDPSAFTRMWTGEIIMSRTSGPLYEYACHETNYSLPDILKGARAEEKHGTETR